jgi:hypothetical protein
MIEANLALLRKILHLLLISALRFISINGAISFNKSPSENGAELVYHKYTINSKLSWRPDARKTVDWI